MSQKVCPTCGAVHMELGDVRYDVDTHTCTIDGVPFLAPQRISDVLAALASKKGQVATKMFIMEWVYGLDVDWPDIKVIDVLVCKLRKVLPDTHRVETVWGRGYRLVRNSSATIKKLVA
jgi:DNA-binding response OmpR family regulator